MNLNVIKTFCERRDGGLKRLAYDIGMSEQNLHRCIRNNKIQANDLEKIAVLLNKDIRVFFDQRVIVEDSDSAGDKGETAGNASTALQSSGTIPEGMSVATAERIRLLEQLVAEKERLIKLYESIWTEKK